MVSQIKPKRKGSKILFEKNSPKKQELPKSKTVKKKIKWLKSEPKQLFNKNIKHPYTERVEQRAEMMRQFYQAKIYIKEKRARSTSGVETCPVETLHPIVTDERSAENNISATHDVTPSMLLQLTTRTELDDQTISLALKYLRKHYPLHKGLEDTTVRYADKFCNHNGNFYIIVNVNYHLITLYCTKRNEVRKIIKDTP